MVEKWWKKTNSTQFSWKRLMKAIVRLAKRNYRHIGYDEVDSNTVKESDIEKVEEDILDLQDDLESIVVEVWDTMNERIKEKDFKAFKGRLRFGQYEPHIDKVFQDILVLPSVKNIDNFFDNITPCVYFVDIGLLIKLVNMRYLKFEPVKGKVYEYNKKMIDFRQTTVALVVKALMKSNLHPRKPEGQDYKLIVERLALDTYKCSLEHLNKLRISHYEKLRELNLLEVSLMVFNNVEISSVVVTWLVKAEEAEFFERMFDYCISEGIFFDHNSIVDIRLNGRVFQTMEQALFQATYDDNARAVDTLLNTWNQAKHNLNKLNKEKRPV